MRLTVALFTLVKALGVSFDSIFDPASEQVEAEIQEIAGLYRACPEQGQRLILVAIRAVVNELSKEKKNALARTTKNRTHQRPVF